MVSSTTAISPNGGWSQPAFLLTEFHCCSTKVFESSLRRCKFRILQFISG